MIRPGMGRFLHDTLLMLGADADTLRKLSQTGSRYLSPNVFMRLRLGALYSCGISRVGLNFSFL